MGYIKENKVYADSDKDNLSFPIGTIVSLQSSSLYNRSASINVYRTASNHNYGSGVYGSPLSGTWRARGFSGSASSDYCTLFQRIA